MSKSDADRLGYSQKAKNPPAWSDDMLTVGRLLITRGYMPDLEHTGDPEWKRMFVIDPAYGGQIGQVKFHRGTLYSTKPNSDMKQLPIWMEIPAVIRGGSATPTTEAPLGLGCPEPWTLEEKSGFATAYDANHNMVPELTDIELGWTDTTTGIYYSPEEAFERLSRIIACVNACAGIPTRHFGVIVTFFGVARKAGVL